MAAPYVSWMVVDESEHPIMLQSSELKELYGINYQEEEEWDDVYATWVPILRVKRPFRGLAILMSALAKSGKEIESFVVKPRYDGGGFQECWNAGISHWYFREWHAGLHNMISVFSHLRRLDLVMNSEKEKNGFETVRQGHLRRVLRSAQMLEDLTLELHDMPAMEALDPEHLYPRLRSLRLPCGDVDPRSLLGFLRLHTDVIRSLSLAYCRSTTVTWTTLLYGLREHRLCLDQFSVCEILEPHRGPSEWWYSGPQEDFKKFVLLGRPFPWFLGGGVCGTPPSRFVSEMPSGTT